MAAAALTASPVLAADAADAGGIDMTMTMLRTAGALAMIIGMLLAAVWFLRRFGGARFGSGGMGSMIQVMDTRMIGPRRYVTVLRVGGRTLAVGVTEQNMTLLAELSDEDLTRNDSGEAAPPGFADVLGKITGGKNDRGKAQG